MSSSPDVSPPSAGSRRPSPRAARKGVERIRIARGSVRNLTPLLVGVLVGVAVVLIGGVSLVHLFGPRFALAIPVTLVALVGALLLHANLPGWIELGAEGLRIDWRGSEQYVAFSDVVGAELYRVSTMGKTIIGVELARRGGEPVRLPIGEDQFGADAKAAELRERIRAALRAFEAGEVGESSAVLAREGQPLDAWVRRLRAIGAGAADGPREAALSTERLWRIVDSPAAAAPLRASAAVALGPRLDGEGKARLGDVAAATASRRLRVVLEQAGEQEAELASALEELERDERGAS